jgi:hypothetical protein
MGGRKDGCVCVSVHASRTDHRHLPTTQCTQHTHTHRISDHHHHGFLSSSISGGVGGGGGYHHHYRHAHTPPTGMEMECIVRNDDDGGEGPRRWWHKDDGVLTEWGMKGSKKRRGPRWIGIIPPHTHTPTHTPIHTPIYYFLSPLFRVNRERLPSWFHANTHINPPHNTHPPTHTHTPIHTTTGSGFRYGSMPTHLPSTAAGAFSLSAAASSPLGMYMSLCICTCMFCMCVCVF